MTYRTTEAADRDITDLYADGEAQFGIRQAERCQNRLFDLFDLIADDPALRASGVSSRRRSAFMPPTRTSSLTRSRMRAC
ncbi:type II toxin-antitoxin system RelE/ParE family toxin [Methylobacterium sp. E-045]|uniref:type II toxin-antitoxin system RelE/ParE family toxin n=1 Tax=Methylobacterium sp. E-045 TaxID=2836575 RepID=UPI001FBAD15D|nr:type II toxin-antitoxin system RelE/ParE family toxin [Methylobacterium sp. E-045]MCJ2129897.1 type II toxin-antitoxin system RelE/ParE family toxin [Methylobacterium sp. E-045]